jgi:RNA polymerase sigma-70 factor (ECF subfamily)
MTFDDNSLTEFVRSEFSALYRFARHLVPQASAAADLTRETFRQAVRTAHTFNGQIKPSVWLARLAVEKYKSTSHGDLVDEKKSLPQEALHALKEEERIVLVLKECELKTDDEIAAILNTSIGSVRQRLTKARDHFRAARQLLKAKHP